jgi:hypothetical protein
MEKMKATENTEEFATELSEQQLAAIEYLISGKAKMDIAKLLKVAPSTISGWFKQGMFVVQLNARRQDMFQSMAERLRSLAPKALSALEKGLESENEATRLRVAELILKTVKLADIPLPSGPMTTEEFERDQSFQKSMTNMLDSFNS